jgi:hypothetical protein
VDLRQIEKEGGGRLRAMGRRIAYGELVEGEGVVSRGVHLRHEGGELQRRCIKVLVLEGGPLGGRLPCPRLPSPRSFLRILRPFLCILTYIHALRCPARTKSAPRCGSAGLLNGLLRSCQRHFVGSLGFGPRGFFFRSCFARLSFGLFSGLLFLQALTFFA